MAKLAEAEPGELYDGIEPMLLLGLPFVRTAVSESWFDWPALPDLFPVSFPGVKTSPDGFLVDVDLDRLQARIWDYFDPAFSHEEIARYASALPTGRLTIAGSIGRRKQSCSTRNAPTIGLHGYSLKVGFHIFTAPD